MRFPESGGIPEKNPKSLIGDLARENKIQDLEIGLRKWNDEQGADFLTGAKNLEFFTRKLDQLLEATHEHRRGKEAVALIYVDLNDFKMVNDTYGHAMGDEVLQKVVGALTDSVREESDIVARIGGDELALILPGATIEVAQRVAEKSRTAIAELKFETNPNLPPLTISASFGVASSSGLTNTMELRKAADKALYAEKDTKKKK
ncbi:MAG: GGDEF domain-containing protein [bacterium]|nr:GGDEF domain-containing protein [bacterium]